MAQLLVEANGWKGCICSTIGQLGCPVHDSAEAESLYDTETGDGPVHEYECLMLTDGNLTVQSLSAMSTSHAFEEASYEFEGRCLAARRGEFLHNN